MLEPTINDMHLPMELDIGASVSILSQEIVKKFLPLTQVKRSGVIVNTYSGEHLKVIGEILAIVEYNGQLNLAVPLVVDGNEYKLFEGNWLSKIKLDWHDIKQIYSGVESLL